jgi:hypothetical protein
MFMDMDMDMDKERDKNKDRYRDRNTSYVHGLVCDKVFIQIKKIGTDLYSSLC